MNVIQYSPVSCKGLNQAKPNTAKQTTDNIIESQTPNGKTKLPGYNLSFGMAKIVRNPNASNLQYEDMDFIDRCFEKIHKDWLGDCLLPEEIVTKNIKEAIRKYSDNDKAIKYIINKITAQNDSDRTSCLLHTYLDTAAEFKEKDPKKAEKLTRMAFNTKDEQGKTFLDYGLEECKKNGGAVMGQSRLVLMLDKTKDYPDIQYEILMAKDKDGNNFINPPMPARYLNPDVHNEINDYIYKLVAETEEITVEDSIALLQEYDSILNGYNKEVLDILTSESNDDYIIFDSPSNTCDLSPKKPSAKNPELPGGFDELPGE